MALKPLLLAFLTTLAAAATQLQAQRVEAIQYACNAAVSQFQHDKVYTADTSLQAVSKVSYEMLACNATYTCAEEYPEEMAGAKLREWYVLISSFEQKVLVRKKGVGGKRSGI